MSTAATEAAGPPAPHSRRKHRRIISRARLAFAAAAAAVALLVRHVYLDLIVGSGVYDYMGIRGESAPAGPSAVFLLLALLPTLWLPTHLRRPTDFVALFLFYTVHLPTCVLLPVVSHSSWGRQGLFALATLLATSALAWRLPLPLVALPAPRHRQIPFWMAIAGTCLCVLGVFLQSGYLSLGNLQFVEVYAQRLELMARSAELGRVFFYAANWTASALVPFLLIVGLHRRRYGLALAAAGLAALAFVVSSNKAAYVLVPAVAGAYYAFRWTRGRHLAAAMGAGFCALGVALIALDELRGGGVSTGYPLSWGIFFRIFCNNGFMSAIYLDLFSGLPPALYTDSFMRALLPRQLEMSVPALAGVSFSEVPDVHANAHLWADGFANLHYLGFLFAVLCAWMTFWIYASITRHHDRTVAATGLVAYAFTLANTSVHIAVVSNGFFVMCLLLYAWPGGRVHSR